MQSQYRTGPRVAYTYGRRSSYTQHLAECAQRNERPQKLGRHDGYHGGSVWRTAEEVFEYLACAGTSPIPAEDWVEAGLAGVYELELPADYHECTTKVRYRDGQAIPVETWRTWDDLLVNAVIVKRVAPLRLGVVTASTDQRHAVEVYPLTDSQRSGDDMPIITAMEACSDVGCRLEIDTYEVGTPEWLAWWRSESGVE